MAADLGLRAGALLGVDAESWNDITSLVQLSTSHRAVLLRFKPCCAHPPARTALAALMADPAVGKVGVGLLDDARAMWRDSRGAIVMHGGFDVAPALLRDNGTQLGLAKGFNSVFGTEVSFFLGTEAWPCTGGPSFEGKAQGGPQLRHWHRGVGRGAFEGEAPRRE